MHAATKTADSHVNIPHMTPIRRRVASTHRVPNIRGGYLRDVNALSRGGKNPVSCAGAEENMGQKSTGSSVMTHALHSVSGGLQRSADHASRNTRLRIFDLENPTAHMHNLPRHTQGGSRSVRSGLARSDSKKQEPVAVSLSFCDLWWSIPIPGLRNSQSR